MQIKKSTSLLNHDDRLSAQKIAQFNKVLPRNCILSLYSRPTQYRPSVNRLPPNTAADFQVQNMFFLGYIISDSLNRRFQYRHYFAGPKSGGIGGYPSLIKDKWIIAVHQ